VSNMARC